MNVKCLFTSLAIVAMGSVTLSAQAPRNGQPARPVVKTQRPPIPRGYVLFGGGYSSAANDFDTHTTLRSSAENGSYDVDYSLGGGPGLTIGAGIRAWKQLGVRIGASRFLGSTPATLTASVPHPFFFNKPRTTTGTIDGLTREDVSLDLHVLGMLPVNRRMMVSVFAGPTWMRVSQGIVQSFAYTETYPYDSIAFGSATTVDNSASKVGFGAGADITYFLNRTVGVSGTVQFAGATMDLPVNEETISIKTGGARLSVGVVIKIP